MKFVLAKTRRYWWPVTVRLPDPEVPGAVIEQVLRLQFEPYARDEQLAAQERAAACSSLAELVENETRDALAQIRNWDDVVGEDGQLVPFTPAALKEALAQSWFRRAVQEALTASLSGEVARLGN